MTYERIIKTMDLLFFAMLKLPYESITMINPGLCMKLCVFLSFLTTAFCMKAATSHFVILFFKPLVYNRCTTPPCINDIEDHLHHMHKPGFINATKLHQMISSPAIQGIPAVYFGSASYSDENGQLRFPQQQEADSFIVVITRHIYPILLLSNTVHHFEAASDRPIQFYLFTRSKNDDGTAEWNVATMEPPKHYRIPNDAIIIFADPAHIVIHEGTFHADSGPHNILPSIYVTDKITSAHNAMDYLRFSKFFSPLTTSFGFAPDRFVSLEQGNTSL